MDRGTLAFWGLIASLLSASAYFGISAEVRRAEIHASELSLQTGDIVYFVSATDGDTIVVSTAGGAQASIRLIGIKAFDPQRDKDSIAVHGQNAVDTLKRLLEEKPLRVMLHATPRDKYGRTLATILADEHDAGLELISQGLAMVYTVYPFPAMQLYLREQAMARASRRGLWANPDASARADALAAEWRKQAP